mgnify:CR=1 FL=1
MPMARGSATTPTVSSVAKVLLKEIAPADPQSAATWVAGFPEGSMRDDAVNSVVQSWGRVDAAGVGAVWREALASGDDILLDQLELEVP